MSYCSQCGAEVNGPFCAQCGAAQNPDAAEPLRTSASNPFEAGSQEPANPSAADSATRPPSDPSAPNIPGFFGAIPACFRKYASPHGRASRSEFWFFALWFFIANFFLRLITVVVFFGPSAVFYFSLLGALDKRTLIALQLFWLAFFIPLCFAACRRLHDAGKSSEILWIGLFIMLVFYVAIEIATRENPLEGGGWIPGAALAYKGIFTAVMSFLLAAPPTPGPNEWGPEPKKRQ